MILTEKTDPALIIMAAGIGSRYGGGIKQLAPVGTHGEIIIDYSIHDAVEAGFRKIIFVIRHDIEADFRAVIGNRIEELCQKAGVSCHYAFQEMGDIPSRFTVPEGRRKPWGTGQAVLCCKEFIHEPFAVINADDYYGKEAFRQLYGFLKTSDSAQSGHYCMAGFVLKNTLSDNGTVTRGICSSDENGFLTSILETSGIEKTMDGVFCEGTRLDPESSVSMNMWGLTPDFIQLLSDGFEAFLENLGENGSKKEFLLPIYIGQLLAENKISVRVLPTHDQWFGITYKEDMKSVQDAFALLCQKGVYQQPLFADVEEIIKNREK